MIRDAIDIVNAFELINTACENIKDHDQCEECPMRSDCLDDKGVSFYEVSDRGTGAWEEFLTYADNVEFKKADRDAQYADFLRDCEKEERLLDEYYG